MSTPPVSECDMSHGREGNKADVYQHSSVRTCIRLAGTDTWVYSPGAWLDKWTEAGS